MGRRKFCLWLIVALVDAGLLAGFALPSWAQPAKRQKGYSAGVPYAIQGAIMAVFLSEKTLVVNEKTIQATDQSIILNGERQVPFSALIKGTYIGVVGYKTQKEIVAEQIHILPAPLRGGK